jgi:beta-hydroxylase
MSSTPRSVPSIEPGGQSPIKAPPPNKPFSRLLFAFVAWIEARIAKASLVGDHPIFDNAAFPWVRDIEAQTDAIRAELMEVLKDRERLPAFHEISADVATITRDDQWKTFAFLGYGMRAERNLARCPATAAALKTIPGLRTAFFSILEPGKRIPPHKGPYNGVLRLHLGLVVPEPRENCWIEVGGQRYAWREGEAVIFDDLYVHQVHNDTDGVRVVLFVDFERPCRAPMNWINKLVLGLAPMSDELKQVKVNHGKWEKRYYGDK